jgi:hypothetical protein
MSPSSHLSSSPRSAPPRRVLFRVTLALGLLGAAAMVFAAAPDAAFQSAFRQFQAARGGDDAAAERAADQFAELLKAEPANPVVMAYAGAATSLKARSAMLPWKKMSYAEDGLAQIDKALALLKPAHDAPLQNHTPGSLETRFVAANTFLGVPGFFNRGERGAALLAQVRSSPLLAQAAPGFRGAVLMRSAEQAVRDKRLDDARRELRTVIDGALPQADAARARLKELAQ